MLATWSEDVDLAPARLALERELDAGFDGDVYVICSLAQSLGRSGVDGPFVELQQASSRSRTPRPALHRRGDGGVDPTFGGHVAVECLWDCEAETRRLAAIHVDRRIRLASQRLEELAGDDAQAASVRAAGAERLARLRAGGRARR